ncbi:MAG: DUF2332 domain-containing protein [Allorhizobium sp.]
MPDAKEIRNAFSMQAVSCDGLGSPFTARLCRLVGARLDTSSAVGRHVLAWKGDATSAGDALPLRLAGALHALVLGGLNAGLSAAYPPHAADDDALWASIAKALVRDEAFILTRLASPPQTNEVRRSAALLPGFLTIAALFSKPLVLSEIGASAGLNLQWDLYGYRLGDMVWGEGAHVVLTPDWSGPPPPIAPISIFERGGCDLNPLEPQSFGDRQRLLSYIWADQADRIERTRAALAIAADSGLSVERANAVDWLRTRLTLARPGKAHVIYHSVAWQYLPQARQAEGNALIEAAGAWATPDAPIARLQMEGDGQPGGAALTLTVWPGGETHVIGRADYHGRWVKWTGWPGL